MRHGYLDEYAPDDVFREGGQRFFVLLDFLKEIAIVHVLHHDTKVVGFNERLLEADDMLCFHRGEDAHLCQCVLLLFFAEVGHFDLLEGILLPVRQPLDDVDAGIGAFP